MYDRASNLNKVQSLALQCTQVVAFLLGILYFTSSAVNEIIVKGII